MRALLLRLSKAIFEIGNLKTQRVYQNINNHGNKKEKEEEEWNPNEQTAKR